MPHDMVDGPGDAQRPCDHGPACDACVSELFEFAILRCDAARRPNARDATKARAPAARCR